MAIAVGKALTIGALGHGIERRARRAGVPVNHGFSGAYDFIADKRPASELFQRFVANTGDNALVMCHPGYCDATLANLDIMTTAREAELAYLMSPDWPALLADAGSRVGAPAPRPSSIPHIGRRVSSRDLFPRSIGQQVRTV